MSNKSFLSFVPVLRSGDEYAVFSVGRPVLEEGDVVDVFDGTLRKETKDLRVTDVITTPARDVHHEDLEVGGYTDADHLVRHLSAVHKTAYGPDVPVTVYWLTPQKADLLDRDEVVAIEDVEFSAVGDLDVVSPEIPERISGTSVEAITLDEQEEKPKGKKKSKL